MIPKAQATEEKPDPLNLKLKNFCASKNTITKVKEQSTEWEKISAHCTSGKGLISRIYKEQLQPKSQTTKNSIHKWIEDLNKHVSRADTRWLMSTWKDAEVVTH